jgi:hypothetical protein
MKRLLLIILVIFLMQVSAANSFARGGGGHSGGGHSSGSHSRSGGHSSGHSHGSGHGHSGHSTHRSSFKTHYTGGNYKSGHPKVERSEGAKKAFLRSKGYTKVPRGYDVDHIRPLSEGGSDTPANMQLLSTEAHHHKTARERHKD